jgi:serine/threonine protein phosphatase PrpC
MPFMPMLIQSVVHAAVEGRGEDRIFVQTSSGDGVLIAVADGAGGVSGGAAAADAACRVVSSADWTAWLCYLDRDMVARRARRKTATMGLAAVVALEVANGIVRGASVGDCEAWVFAPGGVWDLTSAQVRKPLLGEGVAEPVDFEGPLPGAGTLVVATDGLWKYTTTARMATAVALHSVDDTPAALVDLVRLPNGKLQDDIAIVVARVA